MEQKTYCGGAKMGKHLRAPISAFYTGAYSAARATRSPGLSVAGPTIAN